MFHLCENLWSKSKKQFNGENQFWHTIVANLYVYEQVITLFLRCIAMAVIRPDKSSKGVFGTLTRIEHHLEHPIALTLGSIRLCYVQRVCEWAGNFQGAGHSLIGLRASLLVKVAFARPVRLSGWLMDDLVGNCWIGESADFRTEIDSLIGGIIEYQLLSETCKLQNWKWGYLNNKTILRRANRAAIAMIHFALFRTILVLWTNHQLCHDKELMYGCY